LDNDNSRTASHDTSLGIDLETSDALLNHDGVRATLAPLAGPRAMPDVASEHAPTVGGRLDRVGMGRIEMPVLVAFLGGAPRPIPARIDVYVDLADPGAKGVHMSRMFLAVERHFREVPLSPESLEPLLRRLVESHEGLSESAYVSVEFDWMDERPALRSQNVGFRTYPVTLRGTLDGNGYKAETRTVVTYSSTCPCSAALARQLIQEQFERDLAAGLPLTREAVLGWLGSERGIVATPHSQRSTATLWIAHRDPRAPMSVHAIIERAEAAIATAVQAAVKREDEQAFALLNGQNLMFCEDAARRLAAAFEVDAVGDFRIEATHFESLHPHDAVAITTRGVPGGYRP
jgi:GTP cyclohydrolase I